MGLHLKGVVVGQSESDGGQNHQADHVMGDGTFKEVNRKVVLVINFSKDRVQYQANAAYQQVGVVH